MASSLIGSRVERKEDKKFLTGKGRYTSDINLTNQTYAYFVRSPHARATISKVDTTKASNAPGVVKILTGEDLAKDKIGGLICGWKIVSQDGKDMKCPPHPVLAKDSVNFVGEINSENFLKKMSAIFFAVISISLDPIWAIFPPTFTSTL